MATTAHADVFTVTNTNDSGAGSLRAAITAANATGGTNSIAFNVGAGATIAVGTTPLPTINSNVTIDGSGSAGLTISGGNANRVLFVQSGTVNIENLTIANGSATGGTGASGGGGGMGAGAAIFVNAGTTTVTNVNFANNKATGGAGGGPILTGQTGGGGGGLGGSGGSPGTVVGALGVNVGAVAAGGGGGYSGGGGGGGGTGTIVVGANGAAGGAGAGGAGGAGGAPGSAGAPGANGGAGGAGGVGVGGVLGGGGGGGGGGLGGGTGGNASALLGGGGAGGGGLVAGSGGNGGSGNLLGVTGGTVGGAGGMGGGGGGGSIAVLANGTLVGGAGGRGGDFGGGGGSLGTGGAGGFGGGGGGGTLLGGVGGFGGGSGNGVGLVPGGGTGGGIGVLGGGGGAAFGGSVFVNSGASLVVGTNGVNTSFAGDTLTGGAGGTTADGAGAAFGSDLFLLSGTTTTLAPSAGTTLSLTGTIADDSPASVPVSLTHQIGTGAGAAIQVGTGASTGTVVLTGANTYAGGTTIASGTLQLGNGGTAGSIIGNVVDNANLAFDRSGNSAFTGTISGTGAVQQIGSGTTTLTAANTYTGATTISAGTLALAGLGSIAPSSRVALATGGTFDVSGVVGPGTSIKALDDTAAGQAGAVNLGTKNLALTAADGTFSGAIGGAGGSLTVAGGTQTLAGTNTYTGGTVINPGATLQLGAGGTTGSIAGNVVDAGTLSFDRSNLYTFGGAITGAGTVQQNGTGTTVLTNDNNYTGGTAISAGTLQLGDGGVTGLINLTGNGNIVDNANLAIDHSDNVALTGVISGTGAFQQIGTGTTTLTGANTYTGPTTISAGVLLGGAANTFSAASPTTIATGGTLNLGGLPQAINNVALAGGTLENGTLTGAVTSTGGTINTIGGPASLTLTAGTTTAIGTNTYTGPTVFNGGTLVGGAPDAFSAVSPTSIGAGGTLDLGGFAQRVNNVTLDGGTLRNGALTGAVTSTGGTIDTISGPASVTTTAGTTVAIGTNTYTGGTNVDGGVFQVDGSVTGSPIAVNAGGTLSGVGTTANATIGAGGTLAPGNAANPYGTLTVGGSLGFAPRSAFAVRVAGPGNSSVTVTGTTTIDGGTVNVTAGRAGLGVDTTHTIVTAAGGVNGTFAGLTTTGAASAFLMPTLSYDPNHVYLSILPTNAVTSDDGRMVPNYTTAAATRNQRNVAQGLTDAGIESNGRGRVLRALNQLSVPQARAAFDSLSGEGIIAAQNVAFRSAQLFNSSIFDQTTFYNSGAANSVTLCDDPRYGRNRSCAPIRELADLPAQQFQPIAPAAPNRTWRAWATGWGGTEHISGNAFPIGSASQNNSIYGGTLGVDYQLTPNYLLGVAVGGSNGMFQVDQRGTSGTTTGGHIAIYDLYELGPYYGASSSSFSYYGNQTTRYVAGFGGLGSESERGNFNSDEFRTRLEFGRHFTSLPAFAGLPSLAGFGTVTPFVALEIAELRSNGFTESPLKDGPGLFRLNVSGQTAASAPGYVGLRFQRITPLGNGMVLSPTLQLAYVHEFAPYRTQLGQIASLPGSTFLVDGARPARDAAQVKAGAELAFGPHSALFANFEGELSGVDQLYAGKGGFRYTW